MDPRRWPLPMDALWVRRWTATACGPCRFAITSDGLVVAGSEAGLVDLDPETVVIHSGRLGPGQMLVSIWTRRRSTRTTNCWTCSMPGGDYCGAAGEDAPSSRSGSKPATRQTVEAMADAGAKAFRLHQGRRAHGICCPWRPTRRTLSGRWVMTRRWLTWRSRRGPFTRTFASVLRR